MAASNTSPERFMMEAIALAIENARGGGGGPFGAVVVRDGTVVGRGVNQVTSAHDPSAHAEVMAIREACARLATHCLSGCEIYASCEPCPMCLGAIYWARLDRLHFAATRQDAAGAGFDDEHIYREIAMPAGRRSLPTVQSMRESALVAFAEWRSRPDKTPY
jgi:tRNA(Arg) A34 adenosine deaminase TadA